jgi:hypothetical protein
MLRKIMEILLLIKYTYTLVNKSITFNQNFSQYTYN